MDYWGLNFGPGAESHDLCRFLVGVEDEQTGELTLHEAGHAYALRQSVGGRQDSVEDYAMEGLEWKQRKDALVNQFGSKKKKAAIRARDANVIQAGSVVGGAAMSRVLGQALKEEEGGADGGGASNGTAAAAATTDGASAAVEEARRRFLPTMRKEASTPEGVYSAQDIAGQQELESMERQVDRDAAEFEGGLRQWAKEYSERPRDRCPQFVGRRLALLLDLGQPTQKRRMMELLYLRHMCVFHHAGNLLKGTPTQLSVKLDIPEIVLRHLLEKFTVCERKGTGGMGSYVRTKTLRSQLVVHALCLALVLEGCRLEIGVLAEDFKLSLGEARGMLRELGCTASNNSAQLKLPLTFPRSRKARATALPYQHRSPTPSTSSAHQTSRRSSEISFNLEECYEAAYGPCLNDATCSACLEADIALVNDCTNAIGYNGLDQCIWQTGNFCCYNEVSGQDCLSNDAFFEWALCGLDQTCDTRTCDGIDTTGGGGAPSSAATPAPASASSATAYGSDCVQNEALACADDATCIACVFDSGSDPALSECLGAIDYTAADCDTQTAYMCCFSAVSGEDCLGNDVFWEYLRCPAFDFAPGQTCDTRTCDGAAAGGGTPTTPAMTPAPAADGVETIAPSVTVGDTVAPAEAGFMTAAPSSATDTQAPASEETLEPTPTPEGGEGGVDGGATPEPTSTAERAISTTEGPTTAGEAEDTDASGNNGAGLGVSRSPMGLVVAGLVAVLAAVGV
eukprot:g3938.t1